MITRALIAVLFPLMIVAFFVTRHELSAQDKPPTPGGDTLIVRLEFKANLENSIQTITSEITKLTEERTRLIHQLEFVTVMKDSVIRFPKTAFQRR